MSHYTNRNINKDNNLIIQSKESVINAKQYFQMYRTLEIEEHLVTDIGKTNDCTDNVPTTTRLPIWTQIIPSFLIKYLFPPSDPPSLHLLRSTNIAIPTCYLCVGLLQGLSDPFINVYPLFLNASEGQQTVLSNLFYFPASLKILFGFMSDCYPIFNYRRKYYMWIGWVIVSLSFIVLLLFTDLTAIYSEKLDKNIPSENAPTVPFLSCQWLVFVTGLWLADVMGDSLVAEKSKLESETRRGQLQSTCYACRFFGVTVASPISTVLYNWYGPKLIVILMILSPTLMIPGLLGLDEEIWDETKVKSLKEQCGEIWKTICRRAVWQPVGFIYIYNLLQVSNGAWRQFLSSVLHFTDLQLNSFVILGHVLLYFGILSYKFYFINWSWRVVYIFTSILNGIFSLLQVLLIEGRTLGFSPYLFALGDDVFSDILKGIQFLPTGIMMVQLCPSGSEGASYAMFTTVGNSATTLTSIVSTQLLHIWDVKKETMISGDLSGIKKLTILTTLLQTSGVIFVKMLPSTKEALFELNNIPFGKSKIAGGVFLGVTLISILYTLVVGTLNIMKSG